MGLWLVPFYFTDGPELSEAVAQRLERLYRTRVRVRAPWFDPERSFDRLRGQYNATALLAQLHPSSAAVTQERPPRRVLGLTSVDLFIPALTYVFGEAQLGGPVALVSTRRLRSEVLVGEAARSTLARRLDVEAVHEVGHAAGLVHCLDPGCAMHSSTSADEVDFKQPALCDACHRVALLNLHGAAVRLPT